LGETHLAAKLAVESESRALIRRLPQLLELRFLDGTPLASPETAAWLRAGGGAEGPAERARGRPERQRRSSDARAGAPAAHGVLRARGLPVAPRPRAFRGERGQAGGRGRALSRARTRRGY